MWLQPSTVCVCGSRGLKIYIGILNIYKPYPEISLNCLIRFNNEALNSTIFRKNWRELSTNHIFMAKLYSIKLRETPTIYTEYYGPEGEK